jgi:hypothetical protein
MDLARGVLLEDGHLARFDIIGGFPRFVLAKDEFALGVLT